MSLKAGGACIPPVNSPYGIVGGVTATCTVRPVRRLTMGVQGGADSTGCRGTSTGGTRDSGSSKVISGSTGSMLWIHRINAVVGLWGDAVFQPIQAGKPIQGRQLLL